MASGHFPAQLLRIGGLYIDNRSPFMKPTRTLFSIATLAAAMQLLPSAYAQPPRERGGRRFQGERGARWAGLSDDERSRLKAAHQKAMADPNVQAAHDRLKQARRSFREVMQPAMLKADPSVQPILEKMRAQRPHDE